MFLPSSKSLEACDHEDGGRCTGSASCGACKNCSACKHCNSGGSCGVCRRGSSSSSYGGGSSGSGNRSGNRTNYSTGKSSSSNSSRSSSTQRFQIGEALNVSGTTNLYSQANFNSKIAEILQKNHQITFISYELNGWIKVKSNKTGFTGYIYFG